MITALVVLLALQLAGTVLSKLAGVPVPGPVIGLVALFVFLSVRGNLPPNLQQTSQTLVDNLTLFFVPAGVGIVNHLEVLENHGGAIIVTLVASSALTITVTGVTFASVSRLMNRL